MSLYSNYRNSHCKLYNLYLKVTQTGTLKEFQSCEHKAFSTWHKKSKVRFTQYNFGSNFNKLSECIIYRKMKVYTRAVPNKFFFKYLHNNNNAKKFNIAKISKLTLELVKNLVLKMITKSKEFTEKPSPTIRKHPQIKNSAAKWQKNANWDTVQYLLQKFHTLHIQLNTQYSLFTWTGLSLFIPFWSPTVSDRTIWNSSSV